MDGEQGSRGTASTKTFKKRVARLYFGSEDSILELQRKHPELFKAAGPSEHGVSRRVVADSSPITGEVMKPDEQHSDDVIIESQKNYIYSDNPVESDPISGEDDLKLWLDNGLARLKAEEEESLHISKQLHSEGIAVYCLQSTYIEEVDGCSEITREQLLKDERMIFRDVDEKYLKTDPNSDVHYVRICDGQETSTPLVMLHGIGGAIPAFHMLFSKQGPESRYLFTNRPVYIIDMPGFGLSKRNMEFIDKKTEERNEIKEILNEEDRKKSLAELDQYIADTCEKKMLEYIEKWRIAMKIDKMILFGHSFGGYISAAYADQFPEQVEQLVLMEPWGIFSSNEYGSTDESLLTFIKLLKLSHLWEPADFLKHYCWSFREDPFEKFSHLGYIIGKLILKNFIMKPEESELYEKNGCLKYLVNVHQMKEQQNGLIAFCYISGFSFDYSITTISIKDRLSALVKEHPHIRVLFLLGEKTCANNQDPSQNSQDSWFEKLRAYPNLVKEKVENSGHHPNVENPEKVVELIFKHVYNQ